MQAQAETSPAKMAEMKAAVLHKKQVSPSASRVRGGGAGLILAGHGVGEQEGQGLNAGRGVCSCCEGGGGACLAAPIFSFHTTLRRAALGPGGIRTKCSP